jgi:hypothetical protein
LEELTLQLEDDGRAWRQRHRMHPRVEVVAGLLTRPAASTAQLRQRLRSLRLDWVDPKEPANVWQWMLHYLSDFRSVTICAGVVQLEVPKPDFPVPAELRVMTRRLRLLGAWSPATFDCDLACFRARCHLMCEGVCLDTVRRTSEPLWLHEEEQDEVDL